ncbi:DUF6907 domain-containing protein [Streptomyces sp. NPDC004596]
MTTNAISQHVAALAAIPAQPTAADMSQPAIKPGFRLVPTQIGTPEKTVTAWIECPSWCTLDHANDRQVALEDVWHSGEFVDLEMPHSTGSVLLAFFRLGLDPYSNDPAHRVPFIFGEDGESSQGRYLTPDDLDRFCDQAEDTVAKLREMAQACRALGGGAL